MMAMFLHSKQQNIPMDSRDTRTDPHRVKVLPWFIKGPYIALELDLRILLLFPGQVYIIYILHFLGPFNGWKYFLDILVL